MLLKTVQEPFSTIFQKLYQIVPSLARSPTKTGLVATIAIETMIPANEKSKTGVNIAPPKRWIFSIIKLHYLS
jgi:hypothetical protein